MSDIALSSATRQNLLTLQRTTSLIGKTQDRLATGLKVTSATDDALAFFKARNLNDRASDLNGVKALILDGINVIKSAIDGLEAIESTLKQMKALAQTAQATPESGTRAKLASQFNELRSQVDNIAEDASFSGINLLKNTTNAFAGGSDTLTVKFNERTTTAAINELVISGLASGDFTTIVANSAVATGTSSSRWGQTGSAAVTAIDTAITAIDTALTTVRETAQEFGTNSSLLEIRREFTENLVNTLTQGAGQLVNADLNEESANLLSLQTRQQLGTISLSIAQQSEQSVLRLF